MRQFAGLFAAKVVAAILVTASMMPASRPASGEELRDRGRKLAETYCSRCHVVDAANKFGGISSTPSFQLIVRALKDWRVRFETFHTRLPHPSVIRLEGTTPVSPNPPTTKQVFLKFEDIDAFVAYAESLVGD